MTDSKFFTTTKRGELKELSEELRSLDKSKKKDAVKKTIAAMTVGKDVEKLFPDVVNCMQTEDLELKKLVYLYLINYSKSQPDLAIMAVNTFVKDSQDPNPLIRALAVRTMGCIRVDKITEYLCDPLQRCLKDDDPYVRKTAAVCVAKLHDINPELVEDRGFLDHLRDMLQDSNPMVVANAVAALAEIQELSGKEVFQVTNTAVFKLLAALNECTEWGQVFILDAMASYIPKDPQQAESIVQRVLPRLQHANGAVVLSAVKVVMKQMDLIKDDAIIKQWCKKMAPPLVTLLSAEPEVQYVALRNINLIVQKRSEVLTNDVKVFFCKYNDPIYVKMEKLEIMIKLATPENIDQVLLEFKEYAQEIDVDFVRKAVRAIGRAAISLERAAERCINVLLELIQTKVNYVVQEGIIVIKDIFRRYPNKYESIIATLCENLDSLDEPEAKASMIWIIGEYAERIDNADELLETFLETFPEETATVQLQLLTATVKLFLKKTTETAQRMISLVLTAATGEVDNPDLRDRAFVYWRLLSTDPEAAKDIVLADKPVITDDSSNLDGLLLDELLSQMSTLASVYHKPAGTFISRTRLAVQRAEELSNKKEPDSPIDGASEAPSGGAASGSGAAPQMDLLGDLLGDPVPVQPAPAPMQAAPVNNMIDELDGLGLMGSPQPAFAAAPAPAPVPAQPSNDDLFDLLGGGGAPSPAPVPTAGTPIYPIVLPADKAQGLSIGSQIIRQGGQMMYNMSFANNSAGPVDGLMIQLNNNSFGLQPGNQTLDIGTINPGAVGNTSIALTSSDAKATPPPANEILQVAIKTNQLGVLYFQDSIPLEAMLVEDGSIDPSTFLAAWKTLSGENEISEVLGVVINDVDSMIKRMQASNVFLVAHRPVPNSSNEALYMTARPQLGSQLLMEFRFTRATHGVTCACKSERPDLAPQVFAAMRRLLS
ncbi:hypothetical protein BSKO_01693 [Bryopsis sp. KO-2023]|nr:hypothetical protein BSKO_01693 [Bryopsis sp. KO-2023]